MPNDARRDPKVASLFYARYVSGTEVYLQFRPAAYLLSYGTVLVLTGALVAYEFDEDLVALSLGGLALVLFLVIVVSSRVASKELIAAVKRSSVRLTGSSIDWRRPLTYRYRVDDGK